MKKTYRLKSKVWLYPGMSGWHFIDVDKKNSAAIKATQLGMPRRGWGSIRVAVKLGNSEWKTSIFPDKSGVYLLPLKAAVRKQERIAADDEVAYTITLDTN
jgi:hypothetical protein